MRVWSSFPPIAAHTHNDTVVHFRHCRRANGSVWCERSFAENIRFLCKVWCAIPTKLRTHRCSFGVTARENQMQKTLPMKKTRVLIVGGGFGRLYAALEFEKRRYTVISKNTTNNTK